MQFALTYAPEVFDTRTRLMGRQSAGLGFLRAALTAKPRRLWCYAPSRALAETFGRDVNDLTTTPPEMRFISWDQPGRLTAAGLLYRADPGVGDDAWHRRHHASARAYSLCGVTHTLSSSGAMSVIRKYLTDPLYPWDAIICTSTVVRDAVRNILESEMEHLRGRIGATTFSLPQFPMIPLGTHVDDFNFSPDTRHASRARLRIEADDVAVLFVGRLSFHGKAHPLPMFLGLERAALSTGKTIRLLLCGTFANDAIATAFRAEAGQLAPSITLVILDGMSKDDRDAGWASADIFTSLSDNVQETFGLTPIEAMAVGLPVVVSDWNGYKDTVRDGIDGIRVPTSMPSPGAGLDFADRLSLQLDNYDHYIGRVSQFCAVDVDATAVAFGHLIESPELRSRMGAAGRRRAREVFDWSVVFRRYVALWDELAERRRADPNCIGEDDRSRRSDWPDPFSVFRSYPTFALTQMTSVRRVEGASQDVASARRQLSSVSFAAAVLPADEVVSMLLGRLAEDSWTTLSQLLDSAPATMEPAMARALMWMAKMGLVQLRNEITRETQNG